MGLYSRNSSFFLLVSFWSYQWDCFEAKKEDKEKEKEKEDGSMEEYITQAKKNLVYCGFHEYLYLLILIFIIIIIG